MKISKSQCSIFKEFYGVYLKGEVEKETSAWMAEHKKECSFCRDWARSFEENREDKVTKENEEKNIFVGIKQVFKKRVKTYRSGL